MKKILLLLLPLQNFSQTSNWAILTDTFLMSGRINSIITTPESSKIYINTERGFIDWVNSTPIYYNFSSTYSHSNMNYYVDVHDSLWTLGNWGSFCRLDEWHDSIWEYNCMDSAFAGYKVVFDSANGFLSSPAQVLISANPLTLSTLPIHYCRGNSVTYYSNLNSLTADITIDSKNNFWVLHEGSLGMFDGINWSWVTTPTPSSNYLSTLHISTNDYIYLNYGTLVHMYDGSAFNSIHVPDSVVFSKIVCVGDSGLYGVIQTILPYYQHLCSFVLQYRNSNSSWDTLQIPSPYDHVLIKDLSVDKWGNLWILTNDDLSPGGNRIFVYNPNGLSNFLGLKAPTSKDLFSVYPNPCNHHFNIVVGSGIGEDIEVRMFDLHGRAISSKSFNPLSGGNVFSVDDNNLANGLYLVEIVSSTQRSVCKLLVKKFD